MLRDFDLKKVNTDEFLMRQGKFGISRNIFFHGFVKIDRNSGQVRVKAFLDLNMIFFSMAYSSWLIENTWLGVAFGGTIAWTAARYLVDEKLLISVVERENYKLQEK